MLLAGRSAVSWDGCESDHDRAGQSFRQRERAPVALKPAQPGRGRWRTGPDGGRVPLHQAIDRPRSVSILNRHGFHWATKQLISQRARQAHRTPRPGLNRALPLRANPPCANPPQCHQPWHAGRNADRPARRRSAAPGAAFPAGSKPENRPAITAEPVRTFKTIVSGGSRADVLYAPGMTIDPASGWPLSAQLAQLLRERIRSGQLAPGDRVPSEPQLARDHALSRDNAQRALAMLADDGLITRRRGVGSIVAIVEPVIEVRAVPRARISARLR